MDKPDEMWFNRGVRYLTNSEMGRRPRRATRTVTREQYYRIEAAKKHAARRRAAAKQRIDSG
jgi:hypothetical protein